MVFKTNYRLMQVKREHSAILSTFIKLPFVIKIFVLSIFEWQFYTGFTVPISCKTMVNYFRFVDLKKGCTSLLIILLFLKEKKIEEVRKNKTLLKTEDGEGDVSTE